MVLVLHSVIRARDENVEVTLTVALRPGLVSSEILMAVVMGVSRRSRARRGWDKGYIRPIPEPAFGHAGERGQGGRLFMYPKCLRHGASADEICIILCHDVSHRLHARAAAWATCIVQGEGRIIAAHFWKGILSHKSLMHILSL